MWYITKRFLSAWGPVLTALALVFAASAQPKYGPPAEPVLIYFSGAMPIFSGFLDLLVKKSGHVIAFGILAVLIMRALLASRATITPTATNRALYLAIICTVVYACLDEIHQSFVPGRYPSGLDIGLDFIGAALFTLSARRWRYIPTPENTETA